MTTIKRFNLLLEDNKQDAEIKASTFETAAKKVCGELGLNLHLTAVFGFGIGFFYPIIYNLVQNSDIDKTAITDESIVMLTICVFAILFKDNKKDIKKLLEELRMHGIYGIAKKLVKVLECVKEFLFIILKNLGKSIITFVDAFSYTTIFVPCAMALNSLITKHHLSIDSFVNHFMMIGLGTLTITAKHYLIDLLNKLKNKFKINIDESKILNFFKTTKDMIVKKFSQYDKDEQVNETSFESEKYLKEIEDEMG